MAFIGREQELAALENMYRQSSFQMMVLYGRRRIGKTTLLNAFSKDKNPLFYTGIESKDTENITEFGNAVFSFFNQDAPQIRFSSYSDILTYITSSARANPGQRLVIILDEYPYMAENDEQLNSVLQREIDQAWNQMNIMLILCGSSITFMENKVLGEKSPLFGRRTGQIDLLPMDYLTSALFVPDYSAEEKAIVYGVTGGIPKYLSVFDPKVALEKNIIDHFFMTAGYFYEEPKNLLRQEFRDVPLYFAIMNAIGGGSTQLNEIAAKTGFEPPKVSQALKKMEAVRLVRRDVPILNKKNRKLVQYTLADNMFRFWFRFVSRGTAAIERNFGQQYYQTMVVPNLHDYMELVFENICQEYTFRQGMQGKFGGFLTDVGKWRGNDPVKRCPADIDVVGIDAQQKTAVIGECKFRNAHFNQKELEVFLDRARLITPYRVVRFLIFSLGGVSEWVMEHIAENQMIEYISMDELYRIPL